MNLRDFAECGVRSGKSTKGRKQQTLITKER